MSDRPIHIKKIPIEYLSDFKRDATTAWQSYGDIPLEAEFPYFEDRNSVHGMVDNNRLNPYNSDTGLFHPDYRCTDNNLRFIHVDLALTGDSAALAMCHVSNWAPTVVGAREQDSAYERLPIVTVDVLARWEPPIGGGQIRFEDIRQMIYRLDNLGFPIQLITFDRFQSADSMQILKDSGFICAHLSLDRTSNFPVIDMDQKEGFKKVSTGMGKYSTLSVWTAIKSAMNSGRIHLPFYLPVSSTDVGYDTQLDIDDLGNKLDSTQYITWVEKEALGASYDSKNLKVKETPQGSIDLLESVAGAYYNALNNVTTAEVVETEEERVARLTKEYSEATTDYERQQIKEATTENLPRENVVDPSSYDKGLGGSVFGGDSIFDED